VLLPDIAILKHSGRDRSVFLYGDNKDKRVALRPRHSLPEVSHKYNMQTIAVIQFCIWHETGDASINDASCTIETTMLPTC